MRFSFLGGAIALTCLSPLSVLAEAPSYNSLAATYTQTTVEDYPFIGISSMGVFNATGRDLDLDGFLIEGSLELTESMYIHLHYSKEDGDLSREIVIPIGNGMLLRDFASNEITAESRSVGFGWVFYENNRSNVYAQLSFIDLEADLEIMQSVFFGPIPLLLGEIEANIEDDGAEFALGFRSNVHENLELAAEVSYLDLEDSIETLTFRAAYSFTNALALTGLASSTEDETTLGLGIRFNF